MVQTMSEAPPISIHGMNLLFLLICNLSTMPPIIVSFIASQTLPTTIIHAQSLSETPMHCV